MRKKKTTIQKHHKINKDQATHFEKLVPISTKHNKHTNFYRKWKTITKHQRNNTKQKKMQGGEDIMCDAKAEWNIVMPLSTRRNHIANEAHKWCIEIKRKMMCKPNAWRRSVDPMCKEEAQS